MASYQKRGGAWRVKIRLRGVSKSATFDTHDEAKAWAAREEAKAVAGFKAAAGQGVFITVADLFRRYADEVSPKKRGERWEVIRLERLMLDPAFAVHLRDFGPEQMAAWRDGRLTQVAPSSVNRELNLISGVFTTAIKDWRIGLAANPVHLTSRPKNPPARKRRTSDAEILAVRLKLGWDGVTPPATSSQWVAWCHALAIETAMRRGEVMGLTRARVNLPGAYVVLLDGAEVGVIGQTKTGRGRNVPLSRRARELLGMIGNGAPDAPIVPIAPGTCDTLFRRAAKAAGLVNLHFHDSRREATTRIAPKVGNSMDLAKITGHRDHRQLMDYFEPDATELAEKLG